MEENPSFLDDISHSEFFIKLCRVDACFIELWNP